MNKFKLILFSAMLLLLACVDNDSDKPPEDRANRVPVTSEWEKKREAREKINMGQCFGEYQRLVSKGLSRRQMMSRLDSVHPGNGPTPSCTIYLIDAGIF